MNSRIYNKCNDCGETLFITWSNGKSMSGMMVKCKCPEIKNRENNINKIINN